MSIRISLLVRPESSVLQQCSMLPETCDHLFSVLLPSKKLWYLLVSIAGSLILLNYDIQSCQVAVLLGSEIIQRAKKDTQSKVNKYQQLFSVHSFQYIVFSLTARHSGELRINPPQRAAAPDRTNHSDGSDDSRRSSHIMAAILQITDSEPRIKRVLKTNEGVVRT